MDEVEAQKILFEHADKFINLANEIFQEDTSGTVGAALRFAASRYSAYEASARTDNLERDFEEQHTLFADEFARMLRINLGDYVAVQKNK